MDDIRRQTPASETETSGAYAAMRERNRHTLGTESEARGGPEAPNSTLGDTPPNDFARPDGMPGARAALPEGSLPGPYLEAQGDEDRTPPPNAPSPVTPAVTVAAPTTRRS
jgi:hypothetical protein